MPMTPPGADRQAGLDGVEAQRLEAAAGDDEDDETGERDQQRPSVAGVLSLEPAVAPADGDQQEEDPPPCREAEEVQQYIGQPSAAAPGRVVQHAAVDGVRPSGIGSVVTPERECEEADDNDQDEPAGLAQQHGDLLRQRARCSGRVGDPAAEFAQQCHCRVLKNGCQERWALTEEGDRLSRMTVRPSSTRK
jgi:hypothetical protein